MTDGIIVAQVHGISNLKHHVRGKRYKKRVVQDHKATQVEGGSTFHELWSLPDDEEVQNTAYPDIDGRIANQLLQQ